MHVAKVLWLHNLHTMATSSCSRQSQRRWCLQSDLLQSLSHVCMQHGTHQGSLMKTMVLHRSIRCNLNTMHHNAQRASLIETMG
jgi:hypothetical protein